MRGAVLLALYGSSTATSGLPGGQCPPPGGVAVVKQGVVMPPAQPLHMASRPGTGTVSGAPWSWIPQDNVMLTGFREAEYTLKCGNYYGYQCRRTKNNTVFSVDCKSEVCDVYAFIYHEPPRSSQTNGRLPQTLPANGWEAGSCAPEFCLPDRRKAGALDAPMECCPMTAFRKQANRGGAVSFTIDEAFGVMDAYYFVIAVAPGARCDSNERQASQEACEACPQFSNAQCKWVEGGQDSADPQQARKAGALQVNRTVLPPSSTGSGRCVSNWCPPRPQQTQQHQVPRWCAAPLHPQEAEGGVAKQASHAGAANPEVAVRASPAGKDAPSPFGQFAAPPAGYLSPAHQATQSGKHRHSPSGQTASPAGKDSATPLGQFFGSPTGMLSPAYRASPVGQHAGSPLGQWQGTPDYLAPPWDRTAPEQKHAESPLGCSPWYKDPPTGYRWTPAKFAASPLGKFIGSLAGFVSPLHKATPVGKDALTPQGQYIHSPEGLMSPARATLPEGKDAVAQWPFGKDVQTPKWKASPAGLASLEGVVRTSPAGKEAASPFGQYVESPAGYLSPAHQATPSGKHAHSPSGQVAASPAGKDAATPLGQFFGSPTGLMSPAYDAAPIGQHAGSPLGKWQGTHYDSPSGKMAPPLVGDLAAVRAILDEGQRREAATREEHEQKVRGMQKELDKAAAGATALKERVAELGRELTAARQGSEDLGAKLRGALAANEADANKLAAALQEERAVHRSTRSAVAAAQSELAKALRSDLRVVQWVEEGTAGLSLLGDDSIVGIIIMTLGLLAAVMIWAEMRNRACTNAERGLAPGGTMNLAQGDGAPALRRGDI